MTSERIVDLRSDTVTRPTPAMREAMASAVVGDDVLGDDPTVHELEGEVAGLLGKDSAMLVPSGTMGNQCAIAAHTRPGDETITHDGAHIIHYEGGAPAVISGVMIRSIGGLHGRFTASQVRGAIRPDNVHAPRTSLVLVENTHNRGGGSVWPLVQLREVLEASREAGLATHIDGARLWNAAAALGVSEREIAQHADSVTVCLSKGLGAPVGSVLCGSREFIARARRVRKMLGGGMRQAGVLASAGLHALRHHRTRLREDHARAFRLADATRANARLALSEEHEGGKPQSNIVLLRTLDAPATQLVEFLRTHGVWCFDTGPDMVRLVTHLDVDDAGIERACAALASW